MRRAPVVEWEIACFNRLSSACMRRGSVGLPGPSGGDLVSTRSLFLTAQILGQWLFPIVLGFEVIG